MNNDSSYDESSNIYVEISSSDSEEYRNDEMQNMSAFDIEDENVKDSLIIEYLTSTEVYKLMKNEINEYNDESFSIKNDQICEICYENDQCITYLPCQHNNFCKSCYEKYLTNQILNGVGDDITCPGHNCYYTLSDELVLDLVKNPTIKNKYQYLITNQFVTHNRILKYCPQPLCDLIIKSEIVTTTVICKCGFNFCFKCTEEYHEPILCEIAEQWEKLVQTDGGSKKWIYENTKSCPNCKSSIQKNGGCNHMFCRQCNYNFCWVCLKSSQTHYACDISTQQENFNNDYNFKDFNLDFYNNVFESMKMSLKLELQFLNSKKIARSDWLTDEFLKEAATVLYLNRRVLMFSYVFAYYINASNQKSILEQNLENLRAATEDLSGILERDVTEKRIEVMAQAVKDKIRYCDSRRVIMLEFVKDGYNKNYWKERLDNNNGNNLYAAPCKSKK
ncbi:hypothetical protein PVAND_000033 [Polypedilum vanderplanki]|uniref:RBR-type E3 ubiquitin transferase n=1 Tax=Polypedilum vanderplanki TaxID=319348 RepID=A0A9J6BJK8_POLVA|nr:hypothetical protein PVAND_000033 [Polypedilum vanderplanki]